MANLNEEQLKAFMLDYYPELCDSEGYVMHPQHGSYPHVNHSLIEDIERKWNA